MSFAREGYVFIGAAAIIAIAAFVTALAMRSWALWLVAFALAILALWVPYFFRDPERAGERGDRVVIAPADGRLQAVALVDEPTFVHGRAIRLSIFMNVFVIPWGLGSATSLPGALLAIPVLLGKLALCGLAIVVIDTSFAKLRFFRIAEFLGAAVVLALVGVATSYVIGA